MSRDLASTTKKKQSHLKSSVQTFGKLITSWRQEVHEMGLLLSSLESVQGIIESIKNVCDENRRPSSPQLTSVQHYYPVIGPLLIGKLLVEKESLLSQVRLFQ